MARRLYDFYGNDDKVEISVSLLAELIDSAKCFRMMYNDWVNGTTPETHPDLNAVEYLLGEADRVCGEAHKILEQAPTPTAHQ